MKISKAVITVASPDQRTLPLQMLVARDGCPKAVLEILIEEALEAGIEEIGIVVHPGDEAAYRQAILNYGQRLCFIEQVEPRGYGHAVYCARDFVAGQAFLHMVGDHLFVSDEEHSSVRQIIAAAQRSACAVSGVQPTRESQLSLFGTVGGRRLSGVSDLFQIERVLEKPTPTEAEHALMVSGLRAGHYLCFFGLHVLTPLVMELLHNQFAAEAAPKQRVDVSLSDALNTLCDHEKYLALDIKGCRYPLDTRYGLLTAQLALALSGRDRDEVLTTLCDLLAQSRSRS